MGGLLPKITIEERLLGAGRAAFPSEKIGAAFGFAKSGEPNKVFKFGKTGDFLNFYGVPSSAFDSKFHWSALAGLGAGEVQCMRIGKNVLSGGANIVLAGSSEDNETLVTGLSDIQGYVFGTDEIMLFAGKTYGDSDNAIGIQITDVDGTEKTFVVGVFLYNSLTSAYERVEQWTVTRVQEKKDGFGKSMYFVDKINQNSNYLIAVDNTTAAETVLPKEQATTLALGAGASGDEPDFAEVAAALDSMSDLVSLNIWTFPDCGYSGATVQTKIKTICEAADYGVGLLSIPAESTPAEAITHKDSAGLTSKYTAYYYPNTKIRDTINDKYPVYLAASAAIQPKYLNSNYDAFTVPLGSEHLIAGTLERVLTNTESQTLLDAEINPLLAVTGVGNYSVTENTCFPSEGYAQQIHIRLLLNYTKNWLRRTSGPFQFKRFTPAVIDRFRVHLETLVGYLRGRDAILSGFVTCSLDNNDLSTDTLHATITLNPSEIIKNINIAVVITAGNVTLSESIG